MHIVVVGLDHRSAPVEVGEKLTVSRSLPSDVLCDLKRATGLWECGIVSTCNRIEGYGAADY